MIDSHAHVAFAQFDDDRAEVIARAEQAGVRGWIEVGTDLAQSRQAVALARQHEGVGATVGVHPSDVAGLDEHAWHELVVLLDDPAVVAVGEVGLDFYRGRVAAEQLPALRRFVDLASERSLPVVFHVRSGETVDAHDELLAFLVQQGSVRGVVHTFSGSAAQARRYLAAGLHISFSGVVTFKNAGDLVAAAKLVPPDRLLIETDCPFLAPMPHRGKRNEPAYVALVAQKLAELRGVPVEEISRVTEENTRRLFGM